ncbi:MAG: sulfatase-like hydrolase/transferase [Pedosphaera sp.]|nr:sulfatase-like hydrolase/transferase [Pedosphaera sp.]
MRIHFWALAICTLAAGALKAAERPNILWLSAEDISPHLGCYGDPHAITPHLDRLAKEGVRYTHAFTTAGVCAPCRSGIITGMYQTTIGTHHMRCNAQLPAHIKPFPLYLRKAGYYCTNNSKKDYQFREPKETWDVSGRKGHWRNRKKGQPFFAVFNFTGCHESGIASEAKYKSVTAGLKPSQRQNASELKVPPYYPDTPIVREDWKRNYELITAMDAWAGELIAQLKADGLYENTIIFFWSDHGVGLPRAKRWLYDSGTRIPLIVRIPAAAGVKSGVSNQLVSSIDLGPTVLKLAGLEVPKHMQGRSFIGGLPRKFVFGARDRMDERYDIIRSVRDKRFRYIRNYEPLKTYYQYMNTPEKGATMREIRRVHAAGKMPSAAALFMAPRKPVEELYDLEADPHEINNLVANKKHEAKLKELREVHTQWVRDTGDLGLLPEAEIEIREKVVGARFDILNGKAKLNKELGRVAALASEGERALPELLRALGHDDASVRYWGAIGVGNIGGAAKSGKPAMMTALKDSAPSVRIAAARALAAMGDAAKALPVLQRELESEHQWGRLAAAIVLDEMDEPARPAIPALKKALVNQPNKYIVRVANRALNELLGTNNVVR